jgi:hypothetical protein
MGESSAQTVREIEETRERLDEEIRELEQRLPKPAVWTKRLVGVAVGGGLSGAAFWFAVRRMRSRRQKKAQPPPVQAVVRVLPERWGERVSAALDKGEWKTWAAAAGGAWVLFRFAELRQLRRMNRALLAPR